jgi:hypothetical protein
MTDVEYSLRLREWLNSVRLPASNLTGPKPRFMVVDPSATSFKVQLYQERLSSYARRSLTPSGVSVSATVIGSTGSAPTTASSTSTPSASAVASGTTTTPA